MASVYAHRKTGIFHVAFRYEGRQYRKSLKTRNRRRAAEDAKAVAKAVEALRSGRDKDGLRLIRHGIPVPDVIFPTPKVKELLAGLDRKPLTFMQLLDKWLAHQLTQGRSERTLASNRHRIKPFIDILGADFRVDYMDKADLDRYIAARRGEGIAEYTIRQELYTAKGILDRAVELEWLAVNPVKAWPRIKPEARKEFLPKDHVEELIATTTLTDVSSDNYPCASATIIPPSSPPENGWL